MAQRVVVLVETGCWSALGAVGTNGRLLIPYGDGAALEDDGVGSDAVFAVVDEHAPRCGAKLAKCPVSSLLHLPHLPHLLLSFCSTSQVKDGTRTYEPKGRSLTSHFSWSKLPKYMSQSFQDFSFCILAPKALTPFLNLSISSCESPASFMAASIFFVHAVVRQKG